MNRFPKFVFTLICTLLTGAFSSYAQTAVRVTGVVISEEDSLPVIGAAVLDGSGQGVVTDLDGAFQMQVPAGTELLVSCIGYEEERVTVPDTGTFEWKVVLRTESMKLDDVVVIAYGVRKQGTVAGSVATVKADKLESTPTPAFDQALQGQVAGLTVLSSTGEPSASATMTIRGVNSINSGTAPLYIVDGVAISASDFNTINPADIESMSVLKDASSTSIYGARASNGVIVITTRRGRKSDRPDISFRTQFGISSIAHGNWDLMDTQQRIQYEKEVGLSAGQNYEFLSLTDVNWLDAVYKKAAPLQSYELGVSGASDKTNYYISGSYYNQTGIAPGSSFERYSFRSSFEQKMAPWMTMGVNTNFNYQNISQADEGSTNIKPK